jgi:hypothetical protein
MICSSAPKTDPPSKPLRCCATLAGPTFDAHYTGDRRGLDCALITRGEDLTPIDMEVLRRLRGGHAVEVLCGSPRGHRGCLTMAPVSTRMAVFLSRDYDAGASAATARIARKCGVTRLGIADHRQSACCKQAAQISIASLGNVAQLLLATARVLLGNQPDPRRKVASRSESPWIGSGAALRRRPGDDPSQH